MAERLSRSKFHTISRQPTLSEAEASVMISFARNSTYFLLNRRIYQLFRFAEGMRGFHKATRVCLGLYVIQRAVSLKIMYLWLQIDKTERNVR
jgi:hypothetical protein